MPICPFLPVYGLSQYGLPMLLYCVLRLRERDRSIRERLLYYAYVVFFRCKFFSGTVRICGTGDLGRRGDHCGTAQKVFDSTGDCMDFTASHLSVGERCSVLQIFGVGESTVSHKAEYALTAVSFLGTMEDEPVTGRTTQCGLSRVDPAHSGIYGDRRDPKKGR